MTIKVTFEFATVEEALVALGKIGGIEAASPAAAKERKPRDDAGKPRRPYKARGATDGAGATTTPAAAAKPGDGHEGVTESRTESAPASPAAAPAASSTVPSVAGPAAVTPAAQAGSTTAPAPTATHEQAQAALVKLFETRGTDLTRDVLSRFGVTRLRDLNEAKLGEFKAAAEKATETGVA